MPFMLEIFWNDVKEGDVDIPGWAMLLSASTTFVDFFILKGPILLLGDVASEAQSKIPEHGDGGVLAHCVFAREGGTTTANF